MTSVGKVGALGLMSHTISIEYVPGLVILSRLKLVSRQDTEHRLLLRTGELACCDLLAIV